MRSQNSQHLVQNVIRCDPLVQNVPHELALAMLASSCTICIRISLVLEPRPRFVESVWLPAQTGLLLAALYLQIESESKPFSGTGYDMLLRHMNV